MKHYHLTTLSFYVDSELPKEKMLEIRNHLKECRDCREYIAGLKTVDALVRRAAFKKV